MPQSRFKTVRKALGDAVPNGQAVDHDFDSVGFLPVDIIECFDLPDLSVQADPGESFFQYPGDFLSVLPFSVLDGGSQNDEPLSRRS